MSGPLMRLFAAFLLPAAMALASCSGGGTTGAPPAVPTGPTAQSQSASRSATSQKSNGGSDREDTNSILRQLNEITTIGSTVDPINGDQNPYGLDIAKSDNGLLSKGDLVICNFNDAANVQGNGTTIVALHPHSNATPLRVAQNASLLGCDALALNPNDNIWVAAFNANDNPIFTPGGTLVTTLSTGPWHHPFGQAFSGTSGSFGDAAFYESNAGDGSLVRIDIHSGPPVTFTFDVIATGFPVNGGAPGSILGPSGLTYDATRDRLYIIDGTDNSITALDHVSQIPAGGVVVSGTSFSGSSASSAHRIFAGPPLNGPISAALLPNGNLIVGNTLDRNGKNLLVEVTRTATFSQRRTLTKVQAAHCSESRYRSPSWMT